MTKKLIKKKRIRSKHRLLLKREVAKRLRKSTATVDRLHALRRKGIGTFPLSASPFKAKGMWLESDIDAYIESLTSVNATTCVHVQSEKEKEKEFAETLYETDFGEFGQGQFKLDLSARTFLSTWWGSPKIRGWSSVLTKWAKRDIGKCGSGIKGINPFICPRLKYED